MKIKWTANRLARIVLFSVLLLATAFQSYSQCYHSFGITLQEKGSSYATLRVDYPPPPNTYVYGEFRWYINQVSGTPVHRQAVGSDMNWWSQYTIYSPGSGSVSVYVTFFDFVNNCVSDPAGYTVSFCDTPTDIYQQYARACGDGIGRIQMGSSSSGVTFQLAKLVGGNYQYMGASSTGYFELSDYYGQDANLYYVNATSNSGCPNSGYIQVGFEIEQNYPPVISGTNSYCEGSGTTLTASGGNGSFKWYNAGGTVVSTSSQLPVSASLSPGTYNYSVERISPGGCITQRANTTITVRARPVDGNISASATTICLGQSVQIQSSGGVGEPHYWCSTNDGASWNVFENAFAGQYSFNFTPSSPGRYRFHVRNYTSCGFCWDTGNNGCPTYPYVDVTVLQAVGGVTRSVNTNQTANTVFSNTFGATRLEGHSGNVVRWEYSFSGANGPYTDWGQGGLTTTSGTCCIGSPGQTIWIRAQVQNGTCSAVPSQPTSYYWQSTPPIVNAGPDQTTSGSAVFSGSATGGNGGIVSYRWTQIGGPSLIGTINASSFSVSAGSGEYVFRLTATDAYGVSGYDDVTLKVVNYSVFKQYPAGAICVTQPVTLRAQYSVSSDPAYYVYVDGEFRWYSSRSATPNVPVYSQPVGTDLNQFSDYSFTPQQGTTIISVTFRDRATGVESPPQSYQIDLSPPADVYQEYARACGDGIGHLQMRSSVANASFQFYKRVGSEYQYIGSSSTGYFQLSDFYGQDADKYYVGAVTASGCEASPSFPVVFDIQNNYAPDVTGNRTVCERVGTVLTASGGNGTFKWYNASGGVESQSPELHVPTTLSAGTHNYSVERISPQGCITQRTHVVVTINPQPVNGTIGASSLRIYQGQSVTITSASGLGLPAYWASNNGGASWNIFENAHAGEYSFSFTPSAAGTYRIQLRNYTACGSCSDPGNNCPNNPYVDITVIPDHNYVMEYTASRAGISVPQIYSLPVEDKSLTTTFFDGLGRPLQIVSWKSTPSLKDHVVPIKYDKLGRETISYLPYTSDVVDGWYKENALADPGSTETTEQGKYRSGQQYQFYQAGVKVATDQFPYAEKIFEPSPLDRTSKQGSAGTAWQPKTDPSTDRSVKNKYFTNSAQEVFLFRYNAATENITTGEYYPARSLQVDKTLDEHNNETVEYLDKEGKLVCKKEQYDKVNGVILYASTYYLYDDAGHLLAVVPPKAVDLLTR